MFHVSIGTKSMKNNISILRSSGNPEVSQTDFAISNIIKYFNVTRLPLFTTPISLPILVPLFLLRFCLLSKVVNEEIIGQFVGTSEL